jgi:hypothetical protein
MFYLDRSQLNLKNNEAVEMRVIKLMKDHDFMDKCFFNLISRVTVNGKVAARIIGEKDKNYTSRKFDF